MSSQISCLRQSLLLPVLVLPWISPFAGGPAPALTSWLLALACTGLLVLLHQLGTPLQPRMMAAGWLLAAAISSGLGLLQYLGMGHSLSPWVNATDMGQAFANLRQRNHFATLTNMGLASLLWFAAQAPRRPLPAGLTLVLAMLLAVGNAASSSRTGVLGLFVLWGLAWVWGGWRQPQVRRVLLAALAAYVLAVMMLPVIAGWNPFGYGMLERIRGTESICSSRLTLWSNVLHLIGMRPWSGWGWGELAYAHFMTPYNGPRFCEILGNAHNLPLHLAVELGLPAAVLLCSMIAWFIWRAKPRHETEPSRQLGWAILALLLLHSLVEYPLWYGPFQMALGLSVVLLWRRADAAAGLFQAGGFRHGVQGLAVLLLLGAAYAAWDYHRVSQIYLPAEQRAAAYRQDTLEKIRASWLFQDQVRFAEFTLTPLARDNAAQLNAMGQALLHFSPEARVVEKLIESALLLERHDEAQTFMARYQAAYPQAYAQWVGTRPQQADDALKVR